MRKTSLVLISIGLGAAPVLAQNPPATPAPKLAQPALPGVAVPTVSFGMGLSCSNCTMSFADRYAQFSTPPRIYSVDPGGPAYAAGLQRGDIILQVNGKKIDTSEGGKAFASVKPGDWVHFVVQRGDRNLLFHLHAAERMTGYANTTVEAALPALASTSRTLDEAGRTMQALQRSQADQLRRLQQEAQHAIEMQDTRLREVQRQMLRDEQQHSRQLESLAADMARMKSQMHGALSDSLRNACRTATVAPGARGSRTLRYSGTLGSTDIEVRGSSPVNVTETEDEVVITTTATVVRLQKKK